MPQQFFVFPPQRLALRCGAVEAANSKKRNRIPRLTVPRPERLGKRASVWKIKLFKEFQNATSDFNAPTDITYPKNVRRLAAVCSSFASTAFHCFLPG